MRGQRTLTVVVLVLCGTVWSQETGSPEPLVRVGLKKGQTPAKLHGQCHDLALTVHGRECKRGRQKGQGVRRKARHRK